MDQLEKLKTHWQQKEQNLPKLSYNDIYKMLLKKSSSIVKWIFIISIAELLFWVGLYLLIPESNFQLMEKMGLSNIMYYANIFHFIVFAIFIFYFFKNHKSIQVTDSTKMLMKNILKTRKTVRYFVIYNVGMFIISSILMDTFFFTHNKQLYEAVGFARKGMSPEEFANVFIISHIIIGLLFVGLLVLFYWVVYGILLRKLKTNYKELEKMER